MSGDFEGSASSVIPADVRMISGCQDAQTSADVSNVGAFQLPDPAGRSGGVSRMLPCPLAHHIHETVADT